MNKNISRFVCSALLSLPLLVSAQERKLVDYVDPFIGTGGHGHTFPGATVPFGMVQLSPDNGQAGWDWCSGYHYSENHIAGFSHTHLSGTGIGDWLDISVMPLLYPLKDETADIRATFNHRNEKASPGYYEVELDNKIKAALTATERVGYHRYQFPNQSIPVLRLDLGFHLNWDSPTETYVKVLDDSTLVGYRYSTGWAKVQRVYFALRTSQPFKEAILAGHGVQSAQIKAAKTEEKGKGISAQLVFDEQQKNIEIKVALSMTDENKALQALGEIGDWNFARVKNEAADKWEHELQKVQVSSSDEKLKRVFYTALYHTCIAPSLFSDADGAYKNASGNVLKMTNNNQRYTVYSLWDTFRALNPLFTITQPEKYTALLNSMLAFYDENGLLPVWDLSTWETNTMTGYHAIPVIADAILKDWPGIDKEKAYKAMLASAFQTGRGVPEYIKYGYMPQDKMGHSASVTLEYGYDDWCIAQVAKKLGKEEDYRKFSKRAQAYQHIFDKNTGFMRAKNSNGKFVVPFDPYLSEHDEVKAQYVEGNAWQHSFFVPHDVRGLANLYGSHSKLSQKLDSLFSVKSELTGGNTSPDVSGMIGQYAHGNEPSHHIAYMYSFLGEPWKTQERVRQIVDSMYHDQPDGYAGNEDCGQMSAWAVWSIAGIYPANPASSEYVIGSPAADEVIFRPGGGKELCFKAINNSKRNIYVQEVRFNGKKYDKTYFTHADIINGGEIEFIMGEKPNKKWGKKKDSWPQSAIDSE
ncbi:MULTISPECIES: GH92 family glycosyl hydrolase [Olivibacter]|jgi:predicted alpha-1,2-mannosidase|uniref:GH92 family glycosyl hydrolase n=1 Tax=Olivibacter oleidegradans TaxID=760123 RepID=A0ABV6HRR2_9SPHI|nr:MULTISPECIES: GH92 family glycosyl hydrolase [Olivibacter]MDM8176198.1 GH92 family glycosyl hydrolase [Olivibacter sp. 47]QEL00960.1 glycoside hydrolase family 92 protein [Olivibacter sp. LS-1]